MRVTPFLCRLHRSAFRYTGRVTDNGRHNQDIGVMRHPSGGLADLRDGGALGALEHGDHLRLFAVVSGPWLGLLCGLNDRIQILDVQRCLARYAQGVIAFGSQEPVLAVIGDQGALEETIDHFLARAALDVVREPFDLSFGVPMGVIQDGVLGGCELGGHVDPFSCGLFAWGIALLPYGLLQRLLAGRF